MRRGSGSALPLPCCPLLAVDVDAVEPRLMLGHGGAAHRRGVADGLPEVMDRRTRWPGWSGDGGGTSLGTRPTLTQLGTKPAAVLRTIRTIGQTANGADLQRFDQNQALVRFL